MKKTIFLLISSYLIIYSFCDDKCTTYKDESTCKADTTNKCAWTKPVAASCAAATCTSYENQTACVAIKSCEWESNACKAAAACSTLNAQGTCTAATYCSWSDPNCAAISCADLDKTSAACTGNKGCVFTAAVTGGCATTDTSKTDDTKNDSDDSTFNLKISFILLIIGLLF